jgi:predicted DCC family thiol-disulfide oxidoreductase YuxK
MATATTPPQRPAEFVVVYDGQCAFCRKQVERFRRRDAQKVFEYLSRQAEGIEQRFPGLADGDFDSGMRLVHPDQSISVGADAVYEIARRVSGWKRLAWLYRVPVLNSICRAGYAWIAKNRHKLARKCEDGACKM